MMTFAALRSGHLLPQVLHETCWSAVPEQRFGRVLIRSHPGSCMVHARSSLESDICS